jgi:hypothetical protein
MPKSVTGRPITPPTAPPSRHAVRLRINGTPYELQVDSWTPLLDLLRDHLDLTGTKKGCDQGMAPVSDSPFKASTKLIGP